MRSRKSAADAATSSWTLSEQLQSADIGRRTSNDYAALSSRHGEATQALGDDPHFMAGPNICQGRMTHPAVAGHLGLPYVDPALVLSA